MKTADLNAATQNDSAAGVKRIPVSFAFSAFRIIPRKIARNGSTAGRPRKGFQPAPVVA